MKRVYCLYRVSTKRQVDQMKDDIPMQRIACHEFADRQDGWVIVKEFLEKGVSGLSSKVCKYFCPYLNFVNHAYFLYRKLALLTYATI